MNKGPGKPFLPNLEPIFAMGINPKTGLPYKFGGDKKTLKGDVKKALRIIDEQNAVNRYLWTGTEILKLTFSKKVIAIGIVFDSMSSA